MTKLELIESLQGYDDDEEVYFTYNYGDHWHTTVAHSIETVDMGNIQWSLYHRMNMVIDNSNDEENTETSNDPNSKKVILLS